MLVPSGEMGEQLPSGTFRTSLERQVVVVYELPGPANGSSTQEADGTSVVTTADGHVMVVHPLPRAAVCGAQAVTG